MWIWLSSKVSVSQLAAGGGRKFGRSYQIMRALNPTPTWVVTVSAALLLFDWLPNANTDG